MSVNFSAVQLRKTKCAEKVLSILAQLDILPASLTIEITESALVQNFTIAESNIEALSKVGVKISLDDFGTGYSSLSYLKHFTIDIVKIDK